MQIAGSDANTRVEVVRVADVIARAGAATELLFASAQIDRRMSLEPGLPAVVADPDLVGEILVRLVASAVQFSAGGRVTIGGAQYGNRVEVWVGDEGLNVDEDDKHLSLDRGPREASWQQLRMALRAFGGDLWIDYGGNEIGTTARLSLPTTPGSGDGE